ncbi:(d)CMP kinase [Pseudoramibacter sp.]|jgi:cytidylate kinase|uniref:(d)CMP kinase n=1 Tax=Pseudoramibacter sp. TaxID=2034862 RepID=UPI0025F1DE5E|nr:(d)CMP kinase [Pseudoramibacter sp.]MCH4072643.1 (d)CMP kinase [Pseudoramibacter sp.]MCH4106414.1 (d)CMP kinase [Pseudoramibacter sp.]
MQIAMDGPAGAGKSTIAKCVAKKLKITYLDTGAMYRAITKGVIDRGICFDDQDAIAEYAHQAVIAFKGDQIFLDGQDVTRAIRTPEVSAHTSDVASVPEVRKVLVQAQQQIAEGTDVIMDGRDIGSRVLPNADYKFYLDAAVSERAKRRYDELKAKKALDGKTLADIEADIEKRDYLDSHREVDPLVCCEDAHRIDTTAMTIDQVCDCLIEIIKKPKDEEAL